MAHNAGGSLKGKDWGPGKRKEFCLQTVFGPKIATLIPARIFHLPAYLEDFRLARSDNCVGQFLKVNLNFSFSFILSLSLIHSVSSVSLENPDLYSSQRPTALTFVPLPNLLPLMWAGPSNQTQYLVISNKQNIAKMTSFFFLRWIQSMKICC